jgi:hypothetical protein
LFDCHPVIPIIAEKRHNFGHMKAQIRAQIQQPKARPAARVSVPLAD